MTISLPSTTLPPVPFSTQRESPRQVPASFEPSSLLEAFAGVFWGIATAAGTRELPAPRAMASARQNKTPMVCDTYFHFKAIMSIRSFRRSDRQRASAPFSSSSSNDDLKESQTFPAEV